MKLRTLLAAAGLAIAAMGASSGAQAQAYDGGPRHDNGRHVDRDHDNGRRGGPEHNREFRRGDNRGYHRGDDRGHHRGYDRRGSRRCWTEYRHHQRVRICR